MDVPPADLTRSITADAALPRRLARSFIGSMLRQPISIWLLVIGALLLILSAAVWAFSGDVFLLVVTACWLALVGLLLALTHRTVLTSARAAYPVGSTVGAGVGAQAFRISSALGASDIAFSALRSVQVHGDALVIRMKGSNVHAVLPRALFDDDDIALLAAATANHPRTD